MQCGDYGLLGPLRDIVHFAERVNLWWAIFLLDRRVALATGLPPSIREECRVRLLSRFTRFEIYGQLLSSDSHHCLAAFM